MKRGSDGAAAQVGRCPIISMPQLTPERVFRLVLHDQAAEKTLALGNDGTIVQASQDYWAITAPGESMANGCALQRPAGCRGPISLMNGRAIAVCNAGLAMLSTTSQCVLEMYPPPEKIYQLFESEAIVLQFTTHVTTLYADGTELLLSAPFPPLSLAHDATYTMVDAVTTDGRRYRFAETLGWHPITLPRPRELKAALVHFNVTSGAAAWLSPGGNLMLYHFADEPMLYLPAGAGAVVTSSASHFFVLNDSATYPSVVPEVALIDAASLSHSGTLFPTQLLGMARVGESDVAAVHYPYVLWRGALFRIH